jgi:hypothetical protein
MRDKQIFRKMHVKLSTYETQSHFKIKSLQCVTNVILIVDSFRLYIEQSNSVTIEMIANYPSIQKEETEQSKIPLIVSILLLF